MATNRRTPSVVQMYGPPEPPSYINQRVPLPELLCLRQTYGTTQVRRTTLTGAAWSMRSCRQKQMSWDYLSYRGAWNPTRLQNTILAVGPGTPASVVAAAASAAVGGTVNPPTAAGSPTGGGADGDDEEEEDHEMGIINYGRDGDDDSDDDDDSDGYYDFLSADRRRDDDDDDDEGVSDDPIVSGSLRNVAPVYGPTMRHGGCINTVAWLDSGWRLSTASIEGRHGSHNGAGGNDVAAHGIDSEECPTQLVTSGDDYLVKVWDVSEAMGSVSPLPGGRATVCPFSASGGRDPHELEEEWQSLLQARQSSTVPPSFAGASSRKGHHGRGTPSGDYHLPGNVRLLASHHTGHQGNVFHVTPLRGKPGVVATCGADGFLRTTDLERGQSSIVVSLEHASEEVVWVGNNARAGMCFSHHFVNQNVGLLCCEGGLRRFDLRLPPRQQPLRSFMGKATSCKACAILTSQDASSDLEGGDSAYVFTGGPSPSVALCDLRMTDHSRDRILQYYRPSGLDHTAKVSVSGLDVSRDGKELLVAYESDQIYTFPIFPTSKLHPGSCTVDQARELADERAASPESPGREAIERPELAAYGAHFNRFTFLKNAKYAGPRDEYICTGSDTGHAWIYEKSTGAVVSFWQADNSTCNGVVPHPTLPVFVTYGIDSTAKLWRSTVPVDSNVDDSSIGRRKHCRKEVYDMSTMSTTVRAWDEVQSDLDELDFRRGDGSSTIFPDQILSSKVVVHGGRISRIIQRYTPSTNSRCEKIGNDLHKLPLTLKYTLYTCLRSFYDENVPDLPVASSVADFKHRVSLIRLRHQADRLGLTWSPFLPWALTGGVTVASKEAALRDAPEDHNVDASDFFPDHPSDWFPYDDNMTPDAYDFSKYFNHERYGDFFRVRYRSLDERGLVDAINIGQRGRRTQEEVVECDAGSIILSTITVLKESGNAALKEGNLDAAAHRYDKAIQYAATHYMKQKPECRSTSDSAIIYWNPMIKTLIETRLNLALLLLKPYFGEAGAANNQARWALQELLSISEPGDDNYEGRAETLKEVFTLTSKAYFRYGSAQLALGDHENAVKSFESSIKKIRELNDPNIKPDPLIVRRLAEVRREHLKRKARTKKTFQAAFQSGSGI